MKIRNLFFAAASVSFFIVAQADAALVAYWSFNQLSISSAGAPGTGTVPTSINATTGTGTISLTNWTGTVDDFGGTTLNALGTNTAEEALSLIGQAGNNSFITVVVSMSGLEDLVVTYAHRGTSTGFNAGGWSYSTDGIAFTPLVGGPLPTRSTSFSVVTADFSSITAIDGASSVTLKYTLSGASDSGSNNRIDNLQINAIPEPSMALLGSLGILGAFRRRRL